VELQTKIPLTPQENQIDYNSKVLLLGSCFVENIGQKLNYFKFHILQNPFGILFHPIAIEKLIVRAINETLFKEEDVYYHNEQWHCFEVHSSVSASEKEDLLELLNNKLLNFRKFLLSASHIIFTYGTAWLYRFIKTDTIVANCNKIPQKKFTKELLSVEEVTATIDNFISQIKKVNPKVIFINTISPIRHLKDGVVQNTRSKAHLISAIHSILSHQVLLTDIGTRNVHYFPSYEIMMDELRDYRFYKEDMIHPNKTAISILWSAFSEVWIAEDTKDLQKEISTIQAGLQHKPFNPESKAHQLFLQDLNARIKKLQKKKPNIKF
jgi:lysophospholipase L1-like esterase